jgi:zinc/manganese transport system permease protein
LSIAIALAVVWAAIALSYDTNWPVGFFVGIGSAAAYAVGRLWSATQRNLLRGEKDNPWLSNSTRTSR